MGKKLKGVTQKELVGVILLEGQPDNVLVVRLNTWKGKDFLDTRVFWHPPNEEEGLFVPTKRGASVPVESLESFISMCEEGLVRQEAKEEHE